MANRLNASITRRPWPAFQQADAADGAKAPGTVRRRLAEAKATVDRRQKNLIHGGIDEAFSTFASGRRRAERGSQGQDEPSAGYQRGCTLPTAADDLGKMLDRFALRIGVAVPDKDRDCFEMFRSTITSVTSKPCRVVPWTVEGTIAPFPALSGTGRGVSMVPVKGLEPPTPSLRMTCSTS